VVRLFIHPSISSFIYPFIHVQGIKANLLGGVFMESLTKFCRLSIQSFHLNTHVFKHLFKSVLSSVHFCCIHPSPTCRSFIFNHDSHPAVAFCEATTNCRGQKYEINQTLLPHWPLFYWAAVKLSCYTVWMAPDGNCLEMADKFTCWAEVQNPLASSWAVSEREKGKTLRGEDELAR